MTREKYQQKKDRKIANFKTRAENAVKRSNALHADAKHMASALPFGQPVLVGHHSEGRDRRYRARIEGKFRKSYEESKKVNFWQSRIEAAQTNTAIYSDDPDAIVKIEAKVKELEETLEAYKAINKIAQSRKKLEDYPEGDRVADLMEYFGFSQEHAERLVGVDDCHQTGIPSYAIDNMRQNCARYKRRLVELQRKGEETDQEREFETSEGTVKILYNTNENRVQLFFPGKPSESTRELLKKCGKFRWSSRLGAWQRQLTFIGRSEAKRIVKIIMRNPDDMDLTTYQL